MEVFVLPLAETVEVYSEHISETKMENSNGHVIYKIVTFISGDCFDCIREMNEWQNFIDTYKLEGKVSFSFYIYSYDFDRFKTFIKADTSLNIRFPLLLDLNGSVYDKYILQEKKINKKIAYVLNSNNEILISGNPFKSKSTQEKYFDLFTETNIIDK